MRNVQTDNRREEAADPAAPLKAVPIIGKEYVETVVPYIDSAEHDISIVVFDWRVYPNQPNNLASIFTSSVIRAAKRGVHVRVITNCKDIIKVLNANGCQARGIDMPYLVHSKLLIIDGIYTVIGSHNYTQSGFSLNLETSILLADPFIASEFWIYFDNLWQS